MLIYYHNTELNRLEGYMEFNTPKEKQAAKDILGDRHAFIIAPQYSDLPIHQNRESIIKWFKEQQQTTELTVEEQQPTLLEINRIADDTQQEQHQQHKYVL